MRTPEQKAKEAERARFLYHNNKEYRERKKEKMKLWATLNKKKIESTPELRAKWKEIARTRRGTPEGRVYHAASQQRYRQKMKALGLYKNHRGNRAHQNRKWQSKPENKIKRAAHQIVFSAVKKGRLKKLPCEVCGKGAVAHHDDYSKPLAVRWLCNLHHYQHHQGVLKSS